MRSLNYAFRQGYHVSDVGEANQAVINLLSEALGLARTDIEIVQGNRFRPNVVSLPLDREALEGKPVLYWRS